MSGISRQSFGETDVDAPELSADDRYLQQLLYDTLSYARVRNYTGYDYFDGMSSRLRRALPIENKWLNIAIQEGIKRAPVNIRPLFLVEQRQNFKGSALFAMANETAFTLSGEQRYANHAQSLTDWLVDNQSDEYAGFCGGHRHQMQQLRERRPAETPNVVPTSYGVKALLRVGSRTDQYDDVARSAEQFLTEELSYTEIDGGARIVYQPLFDGEFYTLNGGAVGARLLVDLYDRFGNDRPLERARKLLDYLATKQTAVGGWHYRDPASASHLSMDNHHNGFIIESYQRYEEVVGDGRYDNVCERAIAFYRDRLFDDDGAPNWDESTSYPRDIHAATQGIIVFSKSGEFDFVRRIIDWVLGTLYGGEGQFYYQERRFYTKRFTLMRWCQAWMAYALAVYFEEQYLNGET